MGKRGRKKIQIDINRALRLKAEGKTLEVAAERLGVSTTTVLRRLEDAGEGGWTTEGVEEVADLTVTAFLGGVKVVAERSLFIEEVVVSQTTLSSEGHISIDSIENGVLRGVRITHC